MYECLHACICVTGLKPLETRRRGRTDKHPAMLRISEECAGDLTDLRHVRGPRPNTTDEGLHPLGSCGRELAGLRAPRAGTGPQSHSQCVSGRACRGTGPANQQDFAEHEVTVLPSAVAQTIRKNLHAMNTADPTLHL